MNWKTLISGIVCLAVVLTVGTAQAQLVAWYGFDGDTTDSSGNGYDATAPNGTAYGTGYTGQALDINGIASRYVVAPVNPSSGVAGDVTMGAWVYLNSDNSFACIAQIDGDYGRKLVVGNQGTGTYGYGCFSGQDGTSNPFNDVNPFLLGKPTVGNTGQWVFMAAVYEAGATNTTMYVDNSVAVATNSMQRLDYTRNNMHIGSLLGNYEATDGLIDNMFVFAGALSASEIAAIRDASDPLAEAQSISAGMSKTADDAYVTVKVDMQGAGQPVSDGLAAGWETWAQYDQTGTYTSVAGLVDVEGNATTYKLDMYETYMNSSGTYGNGDETGSDWIQHTNGREATIKLQGLIPGHDYRITAINGGTGAPLELTLDANNDGYDPFDPYTMIYPYVGQGEGLVCTAWDGGAGNGRINMKLGQYGYWTGGISGMIIEDLTMIPEPGTLLLLGMSLMGLVFYGWRRRK